MSGQPPERQVHVADGQVSSALPAVAERARIGAGALGTDREPPVFEPADRAAARGNGVNGQHWRDDAYPGNLMLVATLEFAGVSRDIGRRAAHIESEHLL